ncbi:dTMP kinase [Inquilinus limosus]|uniref:dTMP kinase n=1 Tax=Inquilinus limosus TaxID=171674 RepID=UPI003F18B580
MGTRGYFITLEGGEGSGKSTHVRRLAADLAKRGIEVVATREPGGSPGAEAIRNLLVKGDTDRWDPVTEALLHFAARRDHLRVTVRPALDRGAWVVSDRYADSSLVYQGWGMGVDRASLDALVQIATDGLKPDLTLVLDVPVEIGLARAGARRSGEDRYERMGEALHQRLREGFLAIAAAEPERCIVIDASGTVDEVAAAILAAVEAKFGL